MNKNLLLALAAVVSSAVLSSCLPLAAGAAAGYVAHKEGYRVQSPIKKEKKDED
ncbi:MAG: hypothetical protein J0M04_12375 [Verrucomicrobia bacterium]|nr:hypothetical protein [Verrucomicrobiota bacterium]